MTTPWPTRAALVLVVLVGAFLRLGGLDQGVRRGSAAGDEQHNFVEPIREMRARPTADPGVRPGYPGLFNHLAFLPVTVGDALAGERGAYVGARGLVAAFSAASVVLIFLLVRSLAGAPAGLLAAALLALSRGEVVHAHFITPDLAVITGAFCVLLILDRPRLSARTMALAGMACGLTIAVKYTGLVLLASLLAAAIVRRVSPRGAAAAGLAAAASFAVAAPFALLRKSPGTGAGLFAAVRDYYSPTGYAAMAARAEGYGGPATAAAMAWGYVRQNVGLFGVALAVVALVRFRPRARLAPAAAALAAGIVAILPAQIVYPRHVLVVSALFAVLAGCGLAVIADHLRSAGASARATATTLTAVGLLAVAPLARPAFALAAGFRAGDSLDEAASWLEKNLPGRPLVASGYPRLALAPRFEVRSWSAPAEVPLAHLPAEVLRHYDAVVGLAADVDAVAAAGLRVRSLRRFGTAPDLTAIALPEPATGLPVAATAYEASDAPEIAGAAWAGTSPWRTGRGDGWIAGRWTAPRAIAWVEIESDAAGGFTPQGVTIEGLGPDARWRRLAAWAVRPRTLSQQNAEVPHGQVFVLVPPAEVVGIRIAGRGQTAWGLSRIRAYAEPTASGDGIR
jgi:hypothetical protein